MDNIIKLDLYGPTEAVALISAIEKQVSTLSSSNNSKDIIHLFALQQIVKRIYPQVTALAAQERAEEIALQHNNSTGGTQ